jgi:hypothetical protein
MGKHRWKGELAKPLLVGVALTNKNLEDLEARLEQAIYESRVEKLALLMEHYKIAGKTDYLSLALALAVDHVPGFRTGRASELLKLKHGDYGKVLGNKRGRPIERTPAQTDGLLTVVEETKKKHPFIKSDREALEFIVAHKAEWHRPANRGLQQWIKTLRNQLAAARRRPEK